MSRANTRTEGGGMLCTGCAYVTSVGPCCKLCGRPWTRVTGEQNRSALRELQRAYGQTEQED